MSFPSVDTLSQRANTDYWSNWLKENDSNGFIISFFSTLILWDKINTDEDLLELWRFIKTLKRSELKENLYTEDGLSKLWDLTLILRRSCLNNETSIPPESGLNNNKIIHSEAEDDVSEQSEKENRNDDTSAKGL